MTPGEVDMTPISSDANEWRGGVGRGEHSKREGLRVLSRTQAVITRNRTRRHRAERTGEYEYEYEDEDDDEDEDVRTERRSEHVCGRGAGSASRETHTWRMRILWASGIARNSGSDLKPRITRRIELSTYAKYSYTLVGCTGSDAASRAFIGRSVTASAHCSADSSAA